MDGVSLNISDCTVALAALANGSLDNSAHGHLLREIKGSMDNRVFVSVKVSHDQHRVAHSLANYGRSRDSIACWLNQPPPFISELVAKDCNSVIFE